MITTQQLIDTLVAAGVRKDVVLAMDPSYVLPLSDWVTGELGAAMRKFLDASGIKYSDGQFDCNHFAKAAMTIADWSWARTKTEPAALALGLFAYFNAEIFTWHAINVAIHRDTNSKLIVGFYEPQPTPSLCLQPKNLSPEEIQSCLCALFC